MQDDLISAGGLTQPTALCSRENKIFFLVPKNKTIELKHQNQIRKSEPITKFFSLLVLIQHARQPDMTQDRFLLFVVYCFGVVCTCSTCSEVAGTAYF